LQAVYGMLRKRGVWPTFRTVDLRFDRDLGITDAQAALAGVPAVYMQRPWHAFGYYDNDEVRLTLLGIQQCEGGPEDLLLLLRLMQWLCEVERAQDPGDESDPIARGPDFADAIGLPVEEEGHHTDTEGGTTVPGAHLPEIGIDETASARQIEDAVQPSSPVISAEIERNRATLVRLYVLAELVIPHFWSAAGWPNEAERWRWWYSVDHRRIRAFRDISDVDQLIDYVERERESLTRQRASVRFNWDVQAAETADPWIEETDLASAAESEGSFQLGDEIDVLLTILRPEIADSAAKQLRAGMYDEAIFAAYRRVEAAVQERAHLPSTIGDALVKQAFKDASGPIRVSARSQDSDRLVQLFGGAIGLYKGDRSHKDKPALPCRSLRECLRQLANASALLDLLDRDTSVAPHVRGYDQHGDMLELWVERATAQSQVWVDERPVDVVRQGAGSLILDIAGVPAGEHDVFIVDGTRTSPVSQIWLTRDVGGENWLRVSEVNIPLYAQETGPERLDASGLRLTVHESGVTGERIVPTVGSYRVGDYVSHSYAAGTP
jgi:hypothetical protein